MKIVTYKALSRKVLAVVTEGAVQDYAVYIDAVEGKDHEVEAEQVARNGSKQSGRLAKVLFPFLKNKRYRD